MRKSVFLAAALLLVLMSGCKNAEDSTHSFYYIRTQDTIAFGQSDALVAPVKRQISDQSADLDYLLRLYFEGPTEEGFVSPFPAGTRLIQVSREDGKLLLEVSGQFSQLEDIRLTLAGACLSATCYDLTGTETVEVLCKEEHYQFSLSDYSFLDVIDTQSGKETQ